MKRECPSLFAALLVSLLVNVLLRSQTAYWPRAGLFSAVVCAPLLAGVGWLFARSWRLAADPVYKLLFGALLVYTSVLELLRLWQLAGRLGPGAGTLPSVCLPAAAPRAAPLPPHPTQLLRQQFLHRPRPKHLPLKLPILSRKTVFTAK